MIRNRAPTVRFVQRSEDYSTDQNGPLILADERRAASRVLYVAVRRLGAVRKGG